MTSPSANIQTSVLSSAGGTAATYRVFKQSLINSQLANYTEFSISQHHQGR